MRNKFLENRVRINMTLTLSLMYGREGNSIAIPFSVDKKAKVARHLYETHSVKVFFFVIRMAISAFSDFY